MIPEKLLLQVNVKGIEQLVGDLFFTAAKQVDSFELKNRRALAET